MRSFVVLAITSMTLAVASAQDAPYPIPQRLKDLYASEWETTLRESPTFASHLGDLRFNDRWPDVSLAAIERRHKHQEWVQSQLKPIDPNSLTAADRLNYLLFRHQT